MNYRAVSFLLLLSCLLTSDDARARIEEQLVYGDADGVAVDGRHIEGSEHGVYIEYRSLTARILPPTIHSISRTSGPVGTVVEIIGERFGPASYVEFSGGVRGENPQLDGAAPSGFTRLRVTVPSGAQSGPITVVNADGAADPGVVVGPVFTVTGEAVHSVVGTVGTSGDDKGWRMLSAPVAGATRGDIEDDLHFQTASGSSLDLLYQWQDDDWVPAPSPATPLRSGTGFILYFFDDATDPINSVAYVDVPGATSTGGVTVSNLDMKDHFHLLGNPFLEPLSLSSLDLEGQGFQAAAQVYDPTTGFRLVNAGGLIAPWQGFFVERSAYNEGSTQIIFSQPGAGKFGSEAMPAAEPTQIALHLAALGLDSAVIARDEATAILFREDALDGWDVFDATELHPPLASPAAALSFVGERDGDVIEKAQESRPFPLMRALELPVRFEAAGLSGTFKITWPEMTNVPDDWSIELVDSEAHRTVDMRVDTSYSFSYGAPAKTSVDTDPVTRSTANLTNTTSFATASTRFVVVIKPFARSVPTEEYGELPGKVALDQNYPNPFNPQTTIAFALPQASDVYLAVYDLLGREVAVLAEGRFDAGHHEVAFEAGELPSGTYVYRLKTGAASVARTMVVVK